ncbi:hypothetical protein LguiB_018118 [Lonicera macranthoides]
MELPKLESCNRYLETAACLAPDKGFFKDVLQRDHQGKRKEMTHLLKSPLYPYVVESPSRLKDHYSSKYAYTMRLTMAGNVYSFGVILLELVTGKAAVSEGIELAKWVLSNSTRKGNWDHILDYSLSRGSMSVKT